MRLVSEKYIVSLIDSKLKEERSRLLTQLEDTEIKRAIYVDDLLKENKELTEKLNNYKTLINALKISISFLKGE